MVLFRTNNNKLTTALFRANINQIKHALSCVSKQCALIARIIYVYNVTYCCHVKNAWIWVPTPQAL